MSAEDAAGHRRRWGGAVAAGAAAAHGAEVVAAPGVAAEDDDDGEEGFWADVQPSEQGVDNKPGYYGSALRALESQPERQGGSKGGKGQRQRQKRPEDDWHGDWNAGWSSGWSASWSSTAKAAWQQQGSGESGQWGSEDWKGGASKQKRDNKGAKSKSRGRQADDGSSSTAEKPRDAPPKVDASGSGAGSKSRRADGRAAPQAEPAGEVAAKPPERSASSIPTGSSSQELDDETMAAREEERDSLEAIYGSEFQALDDATWRVEFGGSFGVLIYLPLTYPRLDPPTLVLDGHGEAEVPPEVITELLEDWTPGEVCVYQWVERFRDAVGNNGALTAAGVCESDEALARAMAEQLAEDDAEAEAEQRLPGNFVYLPAAPEYGQRRRTFKADSMDDRNKVEILHGEPALEKKSTFIAHLARVSSMEQVNWVHRELLSDRKIAVATHNIVAYRFQDTERNVLVSDNDDDGEAAAGGKLAALLEMRGAMGIFVMVSRWYGGIHLGPDRFKLISRTAGDLMDVAGFGHDAKPKSVKKGR
eukprot:TRINITY_DN38989_c0_g1_i1.p1 TRINITY_DN38989_c0_g1~~TRINITY_DN38989_c0_g1_i1.p1  ORF type:complete len:533 (-),score=142.67 TRINITY_DN38989_c0_g1_i1:254-1852(-)